MSTTKLTKPAGKKFYTIEEVIADFKAFENATDEDIACVVFEGGERYMCLYTDWAKFPLTGKDRTPDAISDRLDHFTTNLYAAIPYDLSVDAAFHVLGYMIGDATQPTVVTQIDQLHFCDDVDEAVKVTTEFFAKNLTDPKYAHIALLDWTKKFIQLLDDQPSPLQ